MTGSCNEIMTLRGTTNYDAELEMWIHPENPAYNLKIDILKSFPGNSYEAYKRFHTTFDPEWRIDKPLLHIMVMILLFNPTRKHLKNVDFISKQRELYKQLLKR
jgi:hypothetical protein